MLSSVLLFLLMLGSPALGQEALHPERCGPSNGFAVCQDNYCCSPYGWCGSDEPHCNPANCLASYSGHGSSCAKLAPTPIASTTPPSRPLDTGVPDIDSCGADTTDKTSCPGAGAEGYFYRCCSGHGHCGPKNNLQPQDMYCGTGCQPGFGDCTVDRGLPADPAPPAGVSASGETCGPIVNKRCDVGLCCSGSNFCGTGISFCGVGPSPGNWCQGNWGRCEGDENGGGQTGAAIKGAGQHGTPSAARTSLLTARPSRGQVYEYVEPRHHQEFRAAKGPAAAYRQFLGMGVV